MSRRRLIATCPLCDHKVRWYRGDDAYEVMRQAAKHLASHEGQPSERELFDRAALTATPPQWMPRA